MKCLKCIKNKLHLKIDFYLLVITRLITRNPKVTTRNPNLLCTVTTRPDPNPMLRKIYYPKPEKLLPEHPLILITTLIVDVGCNEKKLQDGFCDDDQNTMTCNFDGGDCCMWLVPFPNFLATPQHVAYFINDFRCQECICKNPGVSEIC